MEILELLGAHFRRAEMRTGAGSDTPPKRYSSGRSVSSLETEEMTGSWAAVGKDTGCGRTIWTGSIAAWAEPVSDCAEEEAVCEALETATGSAIARPPACAGEKPTTRAKRYRNSRINSVQEAI